MKLEYGTQAYQWPGGVGVLVIEAPSEGRNHTGTLAVTSSGLWYMIDIQPNEKILVAHSHTRELEFVRWGDLKPYPSEPIPNP